MVFKMEKRLYIIESTNEILIQKEINKILKKIPGEYNLIKYDLTINSIEDLIEALDTYDMFLNMKVVLGYNSSFLKEKVDDTFNLNSLLKYLNNPSDNILIFITDKINNRLKLVNDILKYFEVIKPKDLNSETFVKENLEDYQMDYPTIKYFLEKVGSNLENIQEELKKLKLYKLEEKTILKSDIDLITKKNIESSIFDLIEAIIQKNKKRTYELYQYFINNGTEIFQILVLLSNQIRLIYNVKVLSNLSDALISQKLGVKEYPVKLARGKGYAYSKKELLTLLNNLAILDEDIKSGKQLPEICFLTFVMQM